MITKVMNINEYNNIKEMITIPEIFSLKGQVGIIWGGAGKLGQQFARTLSLAGALVVIADTDEENCNKIAKQISQETNNEVIGLTCNVVDEGSVKKVYQEIYGRANRIDFIIYNVMSKPNEYYKPFGNYSKKTWDEVINGNLTGAFICCREASSFMEKANKGAIVLISSTYGLVGPDQRIYDGCSPSNNIYGGQYSLNCPASYSASKAGIIGLSKYLATFWGNKNIRVNVLTPGGVYDNQEDLFHDNYIHRTPLGRMAVWSDYNGAILFLVSDASRYMTGSNLIVDGGWTAW
jgi:NAD(P)-dependent dehydrogenase (short-subunit alcohol dehydrogenase family)